jgi:hypothetical protein
MRMMRCIGAAGHGAFCVSASVARQITLELSVATNALISVGALGSTCAEVSAIRAAGAALLLSAGLMTTARCCQVRRDSGAAPVQHRVLIRDVSGMTDPRV